MSKASKWANLQSERPPSYGPPLADIPFGKVTAAVQDDGRLSVVVISQNALYKAAILEPDEALSLARWLLDTFGEQP